MAEQNNSGILERFANTWNIFEIFRRYLQKFECKNLGDIYIYQEIRILDFSPFQYISSERVVVAEQNFVLR